MSMSSSEQGERVAGMQPRRAGLRLRANRVQLEGLLTDGVTVTSRHNVLGDVRGIALDLSIHGARITLSSANGLTGRIMLGDRLEGLELRSGSAMIYSGGASVVRMAGNAERVELGVTLDHASIDLDQVYRLAARRTVSERWKRARETHVFPAIDPRFRQWVAELGDFLGQARAFLDAEEAAIAARDLASRRVLERELLDAVAPDVVARMNAAGSDLPGLVGGLSREAHEDYRAYCHMQLGNLLNCSPFLSRARKKPLGYAGDYEMMNMLYREHAEGDSLFGRALNLYATQSPVAQANINRIEFLGRLIESAIAAKTNGSPHLTRIASIGCGPAQEIQTFLTLRPDQGRYLEVTLIDQEDRAISYCERTLAPIAARTGAKVRVIRESVRRLLTDKKLVSALGECDLIYSAGLFDYLNDRTFEALLGKLYGAVADGGTLAIGNVAALNPDRFAMEYFTEWFLNHRSPEDLRARASSLQPAPRAIDVGSEPIGVNLFLVLQR